MATELFAIAAAALAAAQPAPAAEPPPLVEPHRLEITRDPIDDSVSAFLVFRSDDARLSIGCSARRYGGLRVMLRSTAWFGSHILFRRRPVTTRFDGERAQRRPWRTEGGVAYLGNRPAVERFVRRLAAADRLAVRTSDIEDRRLDFVFDVAGSSAALGQMLDACGAEELRSSLSPAS